MLRASFRGVQFSLADDCSHVLLFRKLMKAAYMLEYVLPLTDSTRRRQSHFLLEGLIANVAQDGQSAAAGHAETTSDARQLITAG
jgi:hypothetical protein